MFLLKTKSSFIFIFACLTILFILYYSTIINKEEIQYLTLIEDEPEARNKDSSKKTHIKLFNLDIHYKLKSDTCECTNCSDSDILAVFIVTSYFGNVEARSAMRRASSRQDLKNLKLRRVFLLGEAPNDKYTNQREIEDEANKFGDIIQGSFQEAYRNLTYKHLMGLNWAEDYCSKAKYIIKMDDDIVVDLKKFYNLIKDLKAPKILLAGYILKGMLPIRIKANKWFVTKEEYPYDTYPSFLSGWLYITNQYTAKKITSISNNYKYFWIDDLYITGILAQKLKIKHYDLSKYFAVHSEYLQCCMQNFQKLTQCEYIIGPNGGDYNLFFSFNEAARICSAERICKQNKLPTNQTCVAEKKLIVGRGNPVIENYRLN